jgi:spore coat protein CotF
MYRLCLRPRLFATAFERNVEQSSNLLLPRAKCITSTCTNRIISTTTSTRKSIHDKVESDTFVTGGLRQEVQAATASTETVRNVLYNIDQDGTSAGTRGTERRSSSSVESYSMQSPTEYQSTLVHMDQQQQQQQQHPLMEQCTKPSVLAGLHPAVRLALYHDEAALEFRSVHNNANIDTDVWYS